jgi:hypothetical protein
MVSRHFARVLPDRKEKARKSRFFARIFAAGHVLSYGFFMLPPLAFGKAGREQNFMF